MKGRKLLLMLLLISLLALTACSVEEEVTQDLLAQDWGQIEELAQGSEVNFYMWGGDQRINEWVDNFAAPRLQELYDIELNRVPMGPNDYLNQLLSEKKVGREQGSIDLVWINGENFKTARENDLLFGPFAEKLPNYQQYLDGDSPEITTDFGFATEGYESPWGQAQFTFTYNQAHSEEPPYTFEEFIEWIKEHPGQFTYPDPGVDFTGSVFLRHIIYEVTGGYEQYQQLEDQEQLKEKIRPALEFLKELKPYLWRAGETYPSTVAQLNNMFADGELMATMAYSSILTSGEIAAGNFPDTARTFVLENGTIANAHFLAIPFNAPHKAGALLTANFLISFEAQLSKYDPELWGDLPVFSYQKLSVEEQEQVDKMEVGIATLSQEVLDEHSLAEMPANIVPIIEREWERVVNQ